MLPLSPLRFSIVSKPILRTFEILKFSDFSTIALGPRATAKATAKATARARRTRARAKDRARSRARDGGMDGRTELFI